MTSKWENLRLGDVAKVSRNRVDPRLMESSRTLLHYSIPVLDAIGLPESVKANSIQSHKFGIYEDSVLVSMLNPRIPRAFRASGSVDSVGSTEFAVLTPMAGAPLNLDFLYLVCSSKRLWDYLASVAKGSTGSRKRAKAQDLLDFPLTLPPLTDQRRIVDLIGALDDAIEAAEQHRRSLEILHAEALLAELEKTEGLEEPLSSVFEYMIGGAWGSPPGKEDTETLALGPSAFAAGRTAVEGQLGTVRSLNSKRAKARFLRKGDIILERSGGSPTQPVGRVLRMDSGPDNLVPSDFMRLLRVDKVSVDPDYAFWVLWSKYKSGQSLQFQKFTTGIRNLNITDYLNGSGIKLPSIERQRDIADIAEAMLQSTANASNHLGSLRNLRTELLTALLSGAHEIPELYEEVMNAV